eukprot:2826251-Rhodomonas_salina.1
MSGNCKKDVMSIHTAKSPMLFIVMASTYSQWMYGLPGNMSTQAFCLSIDFMFTRSILSTLAVSRRLRVVFRQKFTWFAMSK